MKHIQIASLKKRLLSSLIDLALIAGITCLFYFCVFSKVVANVQHFDTLNETIRNEQANSHLYQNDKTIIENIPNAGENELKEPIEQFYADYLHQKDEKINKYWYAVYVLHLEDKLNQYEGVTYPEVVLFEWETVDLHNPTWTKKTSYSQTDFDGFYRSSFGTAVYQLQQTEPIKGALTTMAWGNMRAVLYASLVGTIIPCFIVPISLKNGKTVGKLITKLVVLTDEGYEYQRYKHIFRYLAFYFLEVFGAVFTIGLTLILTCSLALFTKKKRALHDYVAFSVVADEERSVFYRDEEEEKMYLMKSQEKLA